MKKYLHGSLQRGRPRRASTLLLRLQYDFWEWEIRADVNENDELQGYTLDQEGYLQEVLRHRGNKGRRKVPVACYKRMDELGPDYFSKRVYQRRAQACTVSDGRAGLARTEVQAGFGLCW